MDVTLRGEPPKETCWDPIYRLLFLCDSLQTRSFFSPFFERKENKKVIFLCTFRVRWREPGKFDKFVLRLLISLGNLLKIRAFVQGGRPRPLEGGCKSVREGTYRKK